MPPDSGRSPAMSQIESRLESKKEKRRLKLPRRQWSDMLWPMTAFSPSARLDGKGCLSRRATRLLLPACCFANATSERKVGLRRASSQSEIRRSWVIHLQESNEGSAQQRQLHRTPR